MASHDADSGRVFVDAPRRMRELAGACEPGIEWLTTGESEADHGPSALARLYS
jgi:hypothetical protein